MSADTIRLLKILPSSSDDAPICCEIRNTTFKSEKYNCVSYTWLPANPRHKILLNDNTVTVGDNLYQFLKAARRAGKIEDLWIDALCINQTDDVEKSHQVHRMGKIYRGADQTLIWLGSLTEELRCCLETLVALAWE